MNLDLKSVESIDPAVRLIRKFNAQKRIFITGCSDGLTKQYPDIQVMLNTPDDGMLHLQAEQYEQFVESVCREAVGHGYTGLNMNAGACRLQMVDQAHALGLKVWVYTVNDLYDLGRFLGMRVDAITTRKPDILIELLYVCKDGIKS